MDTITFYKSFLGEWLAMDDGLMPMAWYSPDGQKFYQLCRTGFGGGTMSVVCPHAGEVWKGKIHLKDAQGDENVKRLEADGRRNTPVFRIATCPPSSVEFVPLPMNRIVYGLYRLPNGVLICRTGYEFYFKYETTHLYYGKPGNMVRATVLWADSNFIRTEAGDLDLRNNCWEGYVTETLNFGEYEIIEHDNGELSLSKK